MSSMDWEGDPELARIRKEFIDSFAGRREGLVSGAAALAKLRAPRVDPGNETIAELRLAAHRLAGAAESYGFPTLTTIGELVDELLSATISGAASVEAVAPGDLAGAASLLAEALEEASRSGRDPVAFASDPRVPRLRTWVARVGSRSRNGSS